MGELLKPRYVGDTELPYAAGEPRGPDVREGDVDPVGRKATWTLTGMTATHRFLVPAVIQAAGLTTDPVALYWAEHDLPRVEAPYVVRLGWNAFEGLPEPENQIVWACPNHHARGLVDFLARVQFGTPAATQWDAVHQRIDLVDRQLLANLTTQPAKPPTVPVEVFGLTGPLGTYYWAPPTNPWTGGLRLLHRQPRAVIPGRSGKPRRPFTPRPPTPS